ncbi:phosphate acetyltransferase [Clostridium sp. CAG:571]|jgi:phosphate acetyltransferase|nr:phosphate acetyltransferase [Clostridium sp. CAG:571]HJJ06903.1 phosphate acyltransferase [Clostridiaceae bacterium]
MSFIENIRKKAKMNKQTIILPESTDVRILKAAKKVVDEGIANIILVGDKEEIYKISKKEKIDINNIEIVEPNNDKRYEKYVEKYLELSKKFKVTKEEASKCLLDPLYFGMMMVKLGDGDRTCCWS